jgi:hypothetical protein
MNSQHDGITAFLLQWPEPRRAAPKRRVWVDCHQAKDHGHERLIPGTAREAVVQAGGHAIFTI